MAEEKVDLHRDYYPLVEAAKIANRSIDDLIYEAAIGKVHLYVIANSWKVGHVSGLVSGVKLPKPSHITYFGPTLPELPDVEDPKPKKILAEPPENLELCDQVLGGTTRYGRHGVYEGIYDQPLKGPLPIAAKSFEEFRTNPDAAIIELEWEVQPKFHKIGPEKLTVKPESDVLVQEALRDNKIVISNGDLKDILGTKADFSLLNEREHDRWPPKLEIAILAYMDARGNVPKDEKPGPYIREWLRTWHQRGQSEKTPLKLRKKPLTEKAIESIATVVNWNPSPGRPKNGPKE